MKPYDELKAEMKAKPNERANALKEVKHFCREFGFTAGTLTKSRKKK